MAVDFIVRGRGGARSRTGHSGLPQFRHKMCHAIHQLSTPFFRTELAGQRPGHQHRSCHRVNRQGYGPRHFQIFPGHIPECSGVLLTLRFFLFRLRLRFLRLNLLPRYRSGCCPRGRFAVDQCVTRAGEDVTFSLRREQHISEGRTGFADRFCHAGVHHRHPRHKTDQHDGRAPQRHPR